MQRRSVFGDVTPLLTTTMTSSLATLLQALPLELQRLILETVASISFKHAKLLLLVNRKIKAWCVAVSFVSLRVQSHITCGRIEPVLYRTVHLPPIAKFMLELAPPPKPGRGKRKKTSPRPPLRRPDFFAIHVKALALWVRNADAELPCLPRMLQCCSGIHTLSLRLEWLGPLENAVIPPTLTTFHLRLTSCVPQDIARGNVSEALAAVTHLELSVFMCKVDYAALLEHCRSVQVVRVNYAWTADAQESPAQMAHALQIAKTYPVCR